MSKAALVSEDAWTSCSRRDLSFLIYFFIILFYFDKWSHSIAFWFDSELDLMSVSSSMVSNYLFLENYMNPFEVSLAGVDKNEFDCKNSNFSYCLFLGVLEFYNCSFISLISIAKLSMSTLSLNYYVTISNGLEYFDSEPNYLF